MINKLETKLLSDNATMPTRAHETDAGLDIYAAETITLQPQEKALISTDLAVNIPAGYVGLLTSRSGVSSKTNLVVETGKIDAGFQGHMKINVKNDAQDYSLKLTYDTPSETKNIDEVLELENNPWPTIDLGEEDVYIGEMTNILDQQINKGDKLAQLLIVPIETPEVEEVTAFSDVTERAEKGFGSTGYTR